MHPNRAFHPGPEHDVLAEIAAIGFARVIAATPAGVRVAHAPVVRAGVDRLRFHLAKANALSPHLAGASALVLAEGPNGYISANWYADQRGAVPTWNYCAAEAEGTVQALDRDALIALLDTLAATFEPRVGEDWTRAKMEPARFEAMLGAITAFELRVTATRATHKLSQNKDAATIERLAGAVAASGNDALARRMRGD
ncbi:FMN-binding negative transcriptional regulator [Sphingomonas sp.]|uniref:FMN-binding negative transcriptional regulator n=1 Tax=Sphingomonas sp. TaxID=28214 RepID=UPI001DDE31A4|nr:FMN-binding negative transcriptional regulator [Sphingomonas sp.]MBX9797018.1 FMN-binding negative transcriptional regulator [Sphingomonas sp.]